MEENKKYWLFPDGNKYTKKNFTKEEAKEAYGTLIDCTNCIDCESCEECHNCEQCKKCIGCEDCILCEEYYGRG